MSPVEADTISDMYRVTWISEGAERVDPKRGPVDSTFACRAGSMRSNLTATQVSNLPLSTLCCLHEGCLKVEPAVYMLMQCTPLLVEKAGVAPDLTLRFTRYKQVCRQENHHGFEMHGEANTQSKIGAISGLTKWTLVQQKKRKWIPRQLNW